MKRFLFVVYVVVVALLFSTQVWAWEAHVGGSFSNEFWYTARMGPNSLFGNVNSAAAGLGDNISTIGLPGPINRQVVVEGLSSKGADASWTIERFVFDFRIDANPSAFVEARVSFAGDLNAGPPLWASPPHYDGGWRSITRTEEARQSIAVPMLNWARAVWCTPLGDVWFGRRPFAFGVGWSGRHAEDTTATGIGVDVPFGPFIFKALQEWGQTGGYNSPYDVRNADLSLLTSTTSTDRNQMKRWGSVYSVEWNAGQFSIGVLSATDLWNNVHRWPQGPPTLRDDRAPGFPGQFVNTFVATGTTQQTLYPLYGDVLLETIALYAKWTNGRGYLNAEWDQQAVWARRLQGRTISGWPRAWFLNGGVLLGPAKIDLVGWRSQGHDRANGEFDVFSQTGTSQTTATQVADSWSQFVVTAGRKKPLDPYQFLIGFYGTGNNAYDAIGNPTWIDTKGIAARVDYAVAANMTTWVSFLKARRDSNTASWWGQYTGGVGNTPTRGTNVPNDSIGWEVDAGIDWRLLESTLLQVRAGYWQPGEWFGHAYQDHGTLTSITDPITNAAFTLNPGRRIDPITGLVVSFQLDF